MDNQNNNVIKPSFETNGSGSSESIPTRTPGAQKLVKRKKRLNPIILIVLLAIVGGGLYLVFTGKAGNIVKNPLKAEEEKITFDTEYEWANLYGEYIQDYFANYDKFDIAFVELTGDTVPELAIKYTDKSENVATELLTIQNNAVSKTRAYNSAKLTLVTPVKLEEVLWYLYIGNNEYGKYTVASQLIDRTALDATIKVTNTEEVNKFNGSYVRSDFELTFYEIEKKSFKDDFLKKVDRYTEDQEKIDEAINKLKESRNKYINDNNIDVTEEKTVKLNDFTLDFATYVGTLYENGEVAGTDNLIISSLNTLTFKGKELKFSVVGNSLNCDDGTVLSVTGNNKIQIIDPDYGPIVYTIPTEDDKKNSN